MASRCWFILVVVLAILLVGFAVGFNYFGWNTSVESGNQLTHEQMIGDPNRPKEEESAAAVKKHGGTVDRGPKSTPDSPMTRASLRDRPVSDADLGEFQSLVWLNYLDLSGTQVTDSGLKELKAFAFLQSLDLSKTSVTGAGLADLKGLHHLRRLSLSETKLTDAGLAALAAVPGVQDLDLSRTAITNAGLSSLKSLTNLNQLSLAHTKVDGRAAEFLAELNLQTLDLTDVPMTLDEFLILRNAKSRDLGEPLPGSPTPPPPMPLALRGFRSNITDEWLRSLASGRQLDQLIESQPRVMPSDDPTDRVEKCVDFRVLNLSESKITNAGLRSIEALNSFVGLDLTGTKVTDDGLKEIYKLTSLLFVDLTGTSTTDVGVAALKVALPKCQVVR
jgi:internalin A